MKPNVKLLAMALALAAAPVFAVGIVMVDGMEMYPQKDIIDNVVNLADHKTPVVAVRAD